MSNIVSSTRRRSTTSFVPPPKPKVTVKSDSEKAGDIDSSNDEDGTDDDSNDEDGDDSQSEELNEGKSFFQVSFVLVNELLYTHAHKGFTTIVINNAWVMWSLLPMDYGIDFEQYDSHIQKLSVRKSNPLLQLSLFLFPRFTGTFGCSYLNMLSFVVTTQVATILGSFPMIDYSHIYFADEDENSD